MSSQWNPKEYAQFSQGQKQWAQELISKLHIKGDEDILDIGCGDGKITNLLSSLTNGKVVGVDKSESMIKYAKKEYPHITFYCMDATQLQFESKFDIIFSNAVFHWIHNHHTLLTRIKTHLKSGGKALFQFGGYNNAAIVVEAMEYVKNLEPFKQYYQNFTFPYFFPTKDEYEKILLECNITNFKVKLIPKIMKHDSKDEFIGWIRTTWFPYIQQIPKELQKQFIDKIVERLLYMSTDHQRPFYIDMVRIEVIIFN